MTPERYYDMTDCPVTLSWLKRKARWLKKAHIRQRDYNVDRRRGAPLLTIHEIYGKK